MTQKIKLNWNNEYAHSSVGTHTHKHTHTNLKVTFYLALGIRRIKVNTIVSVVKKVHNLVW